MKHPSRAFYFGMSNQDLEVVAKPYVFAAPELWGMSVPRYSGFSPSDDRFPGGGRYFGLYSCGHIYVAVERATRPVEYRCRVWTYPGHKTDRSVAGIMAHEMGHHIWAERCVREDKLAWMQVSNGEKAITSYEPTYEESFAEASRVFILNPDLLREGRPRRFEFFTERLHLAPATDLLWEVVLAGAPQHIVDAAEKFANP